MSATTPDWKATVQTHQQSQEQEEVEELLTVREVSRRLRVDDTTCRRWIKTGALDAITLPHRGNRKAYRIRKSTIDTLLKGGATNG